MSENRANFLTVSEHYRLNVACVAIAQAFGYFPYLVGSVLTKADYHDIDIRLMLSDKDFAQSFDNEQRLKFLNVAVSEWLKQLTGMPIDFQFQDTTKANAEFNGIRSALGMAIGGKSVRHGK
jgi:hypothetical protein